MSCVVRPRSGPNTDPNISTRCGQCVEQSGRMISLLHIHDNSWFCTAENFVSSLAYTCIAKLRLNLLSSQRRYLHMYNFLPLGTYEWVFMILFFSRDERKEHLFESGKSYKWHQERTQQTWKISWYRNRYLTCYIWLHPRGIPRCCTEIWIPMKEKHTQSSRNLGHEPLSCAAHLPGISSIVSRVLNPLSWR